MATNKTPKSDRTFLDIWLGNEALEAVGTDSATKTVLYRIVRDESKLADGLHESGRIARNAHILIVISKECPVCKAYTDTVFQRRTVIESDTEANTCWRFGCTECFTFRDADGYVVEEVWHRLKLEAAQVKNSKAAAHLWTKHKLWMASELDAIERFVF